ncbi:unnamed protein product [Somion occarium]|uniref:Uncharacterized protein n=2 Tax=Somion occarium TaxID=3059160 RepID=A0ABP1E8G5_9APHY
MVTRFMAEIAHCCSHTIQLELCGFDFTLSALHELLKSLPSLRKLILTYSVLIPGPEPTHDVFIETLMLKSIRLSVHSTPSESSTSVLSRLLGLFSTIRHLHIEDSLPQDLVSPEHFTLPSNVTLTSLALHNRVDEYGAFLAKLQATATIHSLRHLDLSFIHGRDRFYRTRDFLPNVKHSLRSIRLGMVDGMSPWTPHEVGGDIAEAYRKLSLSSFNSLETISLLIPYANHRDHALLHLSAVDTLPLRIRNLTLEFYFSVLTEVECFSDIDMWADLESKVTRFTRLEAFNCVAVSHTGSERYPLSDAAQRELRERLPRLSAKALLRFR